MKEKVNSDKSEETKSCPYCMGELALDAVKCEHCGELVEEKKERRNRIRREDKETAEREARRTLQDKAREKMKSDKSGKPESTQKGISESKGIKSWWSSQSGASKGILVLFAGLVVFGGILLASGSDQETSKVDINPSPEYCNYCGGDGWIRCSVCEGSGEILDRGLCDTYYIECANCGGDGRITCTECGGDGVI